MATEPAVKRAIAFIEGQNSASPPGRLSVISTPTTMSSPTRTICERNFYTPLDEGEEPGSIGCPLTARASRGRRTIMESGFPLTSSQETTSMGPW